MHENLWEEYDNFMLSNQVKQKKHRESPHMVIHRSMRQIENSTIFLRNAVVENEGTLHRTINYEIGRIGQGVKIDMAGQNRFLNLCIDECHKNRIFIVTPIKSV